MNESNPWSVPPLFGYARLRKWHHSHCTSRMFAQTYICWVSLEHPEAQSTNLECFWLMVYHTLYLGFSFKVVDKCSVYHSSSVPTVQWWRGGLCIRISFDSVSGFLSTLYQDFLLGIKTLWFLPPKTRSLISNCHSSSSFLISCFCQALFIINCFCSSSS